MDKHFLHLELETNKYDGNGIYAQVKVSGSSFPTGGNRIVFDCEIASKTKSAIAIIELDLLRGEALLRGVEII